MATLCVVLVLSVILCGTHGADNNTRKVDSRYSTEDQLRSYLFQNPDEPMYNKETPPSANGEAVNVDFGFNILKAEIDESASALRTDVFVVHVFTDQRLRWDPQQYDNIELLSIDSNDLWLPDIGLYQETRYLGGSSMINSVDGSQARAIVFANGTVIYVPSYSTVTPCEIDYTEWPMDFQTCKMAFGSWVHDNSVISIDVMPMYPSITNTFGIESPTWKLEDIQLKKESFDFPMIKNGYDYVTVKVGLQRKAEKYCATFFGPLFAAVAISLLAFLEKSGKPIKHLMYMFNVFFIVSIVLYQYVSGPIFGKPRVFCFSYGLVLIQLAMIVSDHILRFTPCIGRRAFEIAAKVKGRKNKKPEHEPLADAGSEIVSPVPKRACYLGLCLQGIMLGVHLAFIAVLYVAFWPNKMIDIDQSRHF